MSDFRISPQADPLSQLTMFVDEYSHDAGISVDELTEYMFLNSWEQLYQKAIDTPEIVIGYIEELCAERKTVNEQYIEIWDSKNREYKYCKKRPIDGVTLYFDIADMIAELTDSELGELTRAIYLYGVAQNNNEPYELKTDNRAVKMLFPTMKAKHDAERKAQLLFRQRQADRRTKGDDNNHG